MSPLKRVLTKYHIILVKMYYDQLVKLTILATKAEYELMINIKCLLTLAVVVPFPEIVMALVVVVNLSPCMYVI